MTRSPKKTKQYRRRFMVRASVIALAVVVGSGIGLAIRQAMATASPVSSQRQVMVSPGAPSPSPSPQPGLSAADYSLTIPAQRSRQYAALPVTVEQAPVAAGDYRTSIVSFQSDGLKVYAQAVLPATPRPAGGYPTIILAHGYVNPQVYDTSEVFYTDFAAGYAKRGFLVLKPDFRGFGKSWGNPEGAYFSSAYVADVLNLTASLRNYPEANPSQVALFGHSMGGHVALTAALVRPDEFKAVILAASSTGRQNDMYYNWTANSDLANPITLGIRQRVIGLFGEPNTMSPFWHQADPYSYLADLTVPVQINHTADDDTVPPRFSADLAASLNAAGHPAQVPSYSMGGHSFSDTTHNHFIENSVSFLKGKITSSASKK